MLKLIIASILNYFILTSNVPQEWCLALLASMIVDRPCLFRLFFFWLFKDYFIKSQVLLELIEIFSSLVFVIKVLLRSLLLGVSCVSEEVHEITTSTLDHLHLFRRVKVRLSSHLASGRFQFIDGVFAQILLPTNTSNLTFENCSFDGLDIK